MERPEARISALMESWGGRVVEVPSLPEGVARAPFSGQLGIDYGARLLYVLPGASFGGMIHEMGHIFACAEEPYRVDELDFVGWEFVMARKLDLVDRWIESMRDYGINFFDSEDEFGDLTPDQQSEFLEWAVWWSRELGLVLGDEPQNVRSQV